jgi:DNA repair exonuclease SbcCD ATPase subunit
MVDRDEVKSIVEKSEQVEEKHDRLSDQFEKAVYAYEHLLDEKSALEDEISDLREDILVLKKVEELFKFLLDEYVHQYAESFSKVVTNGLQTIFHDQDLEFDVNVTQKRKKVYVEFETVEGERKGPALEAFGGGVASVESLLLRVLVILKTGLSRHLVLDESLASLSEEYIENMSSFLKKMCDHLDMDILLVTHNRSFVDHADTSYRAYEEEDDGETYLKLEKVTS